MTCLKTRLKNIVKGFIWGGCLALVLGCMSVQEYPEPVAHLIERFGEPMGVVEGFAATYVWEIDGRKVYVFYVWDGACGDWDVEIYELVPPVPGMVL